jgi:ABC-type transport system involved in multi-copper enzyme maturation permease subunit
MMRVIQVAVHTLKETIRDRVFAASLVFAGIIIAGSAAVSPLAAGQRDKVVKDIGLASIAGIGVFVAVFVGASLLHREMDKRTIYTLLARPVSRTQYLLGKYLGIVLTLGLNVAAMGAIFVLLVGLHLHSLDAGHLAAIYLIAVELAVLASFSMFFSVISSPALAGLFTLSVFLVGHLARDVQRFAALLPPGTARSAARAAAFVLPDLELFNVKGMAVYGKPVPHELLLWATLYGIGLIAAALLAATATFRRKDLP